jgi:hypothetical protein
MKHGVKETMWFNRHPHETWQYRDNEYGLIVIRMKHGIQGKMWFNRHPQETWN